MGVGDKLAQYRVASTSYYPPCNGSGEACQLSKVFFGVQPPLHVPVGPGCTAANGMDLQAEAIRCNIQSHLLLPVYDMLLPEDADPLAVVEMAQHERAADFSTAIALLSDAAEVRHIMRGWLVVEREGQGQAGGVRGSFSRSGQQRRGAMVAK